MNLDYSFQELGDLYISQGVSKYLDKEFSISRKNHIHSDVLLLTDYVLDYFVSTKQKIVDGETFGCGSWLLYFKCNSIYIELHELKNISEGKNIYEFDVSLSIKFLKEQTELIKKYDVPFSNIPLIGQKIAVSEDIYSGSEVNGVRYSAPDHMTGWYLTSNSFNGNVNSLKVDYLYSLLKTRPDLGKFLALPEGYRFFKDHLGEEVWIDVQSE